MKEQNRESECARGREIGKYTEGETREDREIDCLCAHAHIPTRTHACLETTNANMYACTRGTWCSANSTYAHHPIYDAFLPYLPTCTYRL